MVPKPDVQTVRETATSLLVDAGNGLGHPTAKRTMERLLDKAGQSGAAFGAVRSSNHFGIAGYYAMLALDRDMIGDRVDEQHAVRRADLRPRHPARNEPAGVCDPGRQRASVRARLPTTTVPKGKLEVYARKEKQLNPVGRSTRTATRRSIRRSR